MAGRGIHRDFTKAAHWVRNAAEQGLAEAQYAFFVLLNNGFGVSEDAVEAMIWLRKAAEQGLIVAQAALVYRYQVRPSPWSEGDRDSFRMHSVTTQDPQEAIRWLTIAAQLGDAESMFRLGWHFLIGCGVESDERVGESWFRKAADLNHTLARAQIYGPSTERPYGRDRIKSDRILYGYTKVLRHANDGDIDAIWTIAGHYFARANDNSSLKFGISRTDDEGDDNVYLFSRREIESGEPDKLGGKWSRDGDIYNYTPAKGMVLKMPVESVVVTNGDRNKGLLLVYKEAGVYLFRCFENIWCENGAVTLNWTTHAWRWVMVAAEHGSAEAQYLMGELFEKGNIVVKNNERSRFWYQQALNQGFTKKKMFWKRLLSS
jgi:TPR repeat protein